MLLVRRVATRERPVAVPSRRRVSDPEEAAPDHACHGGSLTEARRGRRHGSERRGAGGLAPLWNPDAWPADQTGSLRMRLTAQRTIHSRMVQPTRAAIAAMSSTDPLDSSELLLKIPTNGATNS